MRRRLPPIALMLAVLGIIGTASAATPLSSPGKSAPVNATLPSISGSAIVSQTLTASAGNWDGPSVTFGYQWNRCNSSGASCAPIASSAAQTFLVNSADAGSTLRVTVTASNKNGTTTATSNATNVVASTTTTTSTTTPIPATTTNTTTWSSTTTTTITTTTNPTTTTPSASPFFVGDFETGGLSQWDHVYDPNLLSPNPPRVIRSPLAQGGYALGLTVDPNDTYNCSGGCTSSRTDVYENSRTDLAHDGLDTWTHVYVRFPSGAYRPTNGEWNWFHQWHSDDRFPENTVTGGQEVALGVVTGAANITTTCFGNTSSAQNPQIFGYLTGGDVAAGKQTPTRFCTHQPLQYDHWYDLYEHIRWSKTNGFYGLYLDGQTVFEVSKPTLLYNSANGTVDVPNVELDNYRWMGQAGGVNWSSTIYFDGLKVGPTRDSVS